MRLSFEFLVRVIPIQHQAVICHHVFILESLIPSFRKSRKHSSVPNLSVLVKNSEAQLSPLIMRDLSRDHSSLPEKATVVHSYYLGT